MKWILSLLVFSSKRSCRLGGWSLIRVFATEVGQGCLVTQGRIAGRGERLPGSDELVERGEKGT